MRSYIIAGTGSGASVQTPFGVVAVSRAIGTAYPDRGTALVNYRKPGMTTLEMTCHPARMRSNPVLYTRIGAGPFESEEGHEGGHDGGVDEETGGGGEGGGGGDDVNWEGVANTSADIFAWLSSIWGSSYEPGNGGEIKRQLKSTNPAWADIMISRYIGWLDAHGKLEPRYSGTGDIWAADGFSPSVFFEEYIRKFGSTDVSTGVSQYPFPQGRPGSGGGGGAGGGGGTGGRPPEWPPVGTRGWDEAQHRWLPGYGPLNTTSTQAGFGTVAAVLLLGTLLLSRGKFTNPRRR